MRGVTYLKSALMVVVRHRDGRSGCLVMSVDDFALLRPLNFIVSYSSLDGFHLFSFILECCFYRRHSSRTVK